MSVFNNFNVKKGGESSLDYSDFISQVKSGAVESVKISGSTIQGKLRSGDTFVTESPGDEGLVGDLLNHNVKIKAVPPEKPSVLMSIFINWFPLFILIGLWIFFMRQMQGGGGGRGAMSFGKSKARMLLRIR